MPRKRGREYVEINEKEEDQEPPIVIANSKRRKKTGDGIKAVSERKSTTTDLLDNPVIRTTTSMMTLRRSKTSGAEWENRTNASAPVVDMTVASNGQNPAKHIKKTYASKCKNLLSKTDRGNTRGTAEGKSLLEEHSETVEQVIEIKEDEEIEIKEDEIKDEEDVAIKDETDDSGSINVSAGNSDFSPAVRLIHETGTDHRENCRSQVDTGDVSKNQADYALYVSQTTDGEIKIEELPEVSDNKSYEVVGSGISQVLTPASCNVQLPSGHCSLPLSQTGSSSVGVSLMPIMPNLSANTSAITAIPTPIATFPLLPDMTRDMSRAAVFTVGVPNTDPKQGDSYIVPVSSAPVANSICNAVCQTTSNPHCNSFSIDKCNVLVSTLNSNPVAVDDCKDDRRDVLVTNTYGDHQFVDRNSSSIPIVDLSDDSDSLLVEKDDVLVPLAGNISAKSSFEKENYSTSPTASSSARTQTSSNVLRVDNWGTYLLQKLELLYQREQDCDLVLKFCNGETLKVQ